MLQNSTAFWFSFVLKSPPSAIGKSSEAIENNQSRQYNFITRDWYVKYLLLIDEMARS